MVAPKRLSRLIDEAFQEARAWGQSSPGLEDEARRALAEHMKMKKVIPPIDGINPALDFRLGNGSNAKYRMVPKGPKDPQPDPHVAATLESASMAKKDNIERSKSKLMKLLRERFGGK